MFPTALALCALLCQVPDGGTSHADAGGDGLDAAARPDAATDATTDAAGPRDASVADADAADSGPVRDVVRLPAPLGRLTGQVFVRGSRKSIAHATIFIDLTEIGDADVAGQFSAEVPCGPHDVGVQVPGFEPLIVRRDPCRDARPLVLRLAPRAGAAGYETIVTPPTSRQSTRLEGEELVHTPGSLGDPFRAIESLPGVATVAWPAPIYAVRGSNPGNTGFFLDDLRVPALFHFALGPSVIHPYFFQDLDFYPGGYPARYGRYVAGIVAARTRAAPDDAVHVSIDARLFDSGVMVTAPLPGQGAIAVAGRYSYAGALVGLVEHGTTFGYWDYQLRADRSFGPVRLTLLAFGSNDTLTSGSETVALRFHRVKLRAETALGDGRIAASLGLGSDRSQAPIGDDPVSISAVSAFPRLTFTRRTQHADLEVGFDGEIERFASATTTDRLTELDLAEARTARLLAGYASATVNVGPRVLVTPEVRLDTYAVSGASAADVGPRLNARVSLSDATWVKAAAGRFTQLPSLPLQVPGAENFGLSLYGLQSSWQGSVGFGTTRFWGLDASLTGFVQRYVLTDLRDPVITKSIDPLADDFLVRRDARSYGVEVLVRRPPSERLHGWLSYTLSNNERALENGVIGPSDWDQRHVLNLVLGYRWRSYTFGGRAHYNTGRPVLVSATTGEIFTRLPPSYQLDLRCDRRLLFDKFLLDVYVELLNATFSRQVVGLTQEAPDTPPTENAYRIVLPSIGVHAEF